MNSPSPDVSAAVDAVDAVLPQTQCTRCGYPRCRDYARAIVEEQAPINQCPPGGAEGIRRLSRVTGRAVIPLNPSHGHEGPRRLAIIDEDWCIGCTLCLKACPVDCIIGGPKQMHTVIEDLCTGCELCIPVCPVDCISLEDVTGERTGWDAWSTEAAEQARARYAFHLFRTERDQREHDERLAAKARAALVDLPAASRLTDPEALDSKRGILQAALSRLRDRKGPPGR
ncbi:MAG TPA: electron transport complex subunit RsxB [Albitalea sp.]|nr:electron transport complex subunit RsxB [Albitalea sp.]